MTNARMLCIVLTLCTATTVASSAPTIYNFCSKTDCSDGANPFAGLVQGADGNLYGTTQTGGVKASGTVFRITTAGSLTTLYNFCSKTNCSDGALPTGQLVQGANGEFYGTTREGGASNLGTVFRVTTTGRVTTLYSFCSQVSCQDGEFPNGGLVVGPKGDFYGTTQSGGSNQSSGTIFKITANGELTILYNFCLFSNCIDGALPFAGLVQGIDGNFYGTTELGGNNGDGTIFEFFPNSGGLLTLWSFCSESNCSDGAKPLAGLVQGTDGNFYGTTSSNGASNANYCPAGCGTLFSITAGGGFKLLYTFCSQVNCQDGATPIAPLVQATDGNFYGTTSAAGLSNSNYCPNGCGTAFQFGPISGDLNTFWTFCSQDNCADGTYPKGAMIQHTDGKLYGTTWGAFGVPGCDTTSFGCGTVFSFSIGKSAFLKMLPAFGEQGSKVTILADKLSGASSVSFNGKAATYEVVSDTEITTTVPAGATTGRVSVKVPGSSGTVSSIIFFHVTPQIKSFNPVSGPVGTTVTITGVGLTQTNAVTFSYVPATSFTVKSDTEVIATVPSGAITGPITITTIGGTANGPTNFKVVE